MAISNTTNFLSSDPIEGVLGGLPVAEQTQDYFLVFQQTGGTGPEIIDQTAYFITYMIQSDGTVSKPAEDTVALNNLLQNFPTGNTVNVRLDQGTALNSGLGGLKQLTAIGTQQSILATQIGFNSQSYSSSSLEFIGQNDSVNEVVSTTLPNYTVTLGATPNANVSVVAGALTNYNFSGGLSSAAVGDTNLGTLTITPNENLILIVLRAFIPITNNSLDEITIQYEIQLNRGAGYETKAINTFNVPAQTIDYDSQLYYQAEGEDLTNGGMDPTFRVKINTTNPSLEIRSNQFKVYDQSPQSSVIDVVPGDTGRLWVTGSEEDNQRWLTGSEYLSLNYNKIQKYESIEPLQSNNSYNMSPIGVPFTLKNGDRIRFEYNKFKEYIIYDIITPDRAGDGLLKIKVNKNIPSNTILNNFIIHRTNINDPTYVIIDATKNDLIDDTQNFSGLVLPQYPTQRLKDNLDNIIVNLKERGIIVDNLN